MSKESGSVAAVPVATQRRRRVLPALTATTASPGNQVSRGTRSDCAMLRFPSAKKAGLFCRSSCRKKRCRSLRHSVAA